MLKKRERLTRKEFDRSFSVGKRYHSPHFQLIHEKADVFHGAVVVGKKVYKRAVDRNALRRRLYGVLYRYYKTTKCTGTFILIAKAKCKELSHKEVLKKAEQLFREVE